MSSLEIYQEERPWGYFRRFSKNSLSTVKIIKVNPGETLSLQSHTKRSEFWRVLVGAGTVEVGNERRQIKAGDEQVIPIDTKHRLAAGSSGIEVLEISFGDFDENDIVRYEDKYGGP